MQSGEAIIRSLLIRELGHPQGKLKIQSLLGQEYVFLWETDSKYNRQ